MTSNKERIKEWPALVEFLRNNVNNRNFPTTPAIGPVAASLLLTGPAQFSLTWMFLDLPLLWSPQGPPHRWRCRWEQPFWPWASYRPTGGHSPGLPFRHKRDFSRQVDLQSTCQVGGRSQQLYRNRPAMRNTDRLRVQRWQMWGTAGRCLLTVTAESRQPSRKYCSSQKILYGSDFYKARLPSCSPGLKGQFYSRDKRSRPPRGVPGNLLEQPSWSSLAPNQKDKHLSCRQAISQTLLARW